MAPSQAAFLDYLLLVYFCLPLRGRSRARSLPTFFAALSPQPSTGLENSKCSENICGRTVAEHLLGGMPRAEGSSKELMQCSALSLPPLGSSQGSGEKQAPQKALWRPGECRGWGERGSGGLRAEGRVCGFLGDLCLSCFSWWRLYLPLFPPRGWAPPSRVGGLCSCFPERVVSGPEQV